MFFGGVTTREIFFGGVTREKRLLVHLKRDVSSCLKPCLALDRNSEVVYCAGFSILEMLDLKIPKIHLWGWSCGLLQDDTVFLFLKQQTSAPSFLCSWGAAVTQPDVDRPFLQGAKRTHLHFTTISELLVLSWKMSTSIHKISGFGNRDFNFSFYCGGLVSRT